VHIKKALFRRGVAGVALAGGGAVAGAAGVALFADAEADLKKVCPLLTSLSLSLSLSLYLPLSLSISLCLSVSFSFPLSLSL
jgi:hypothetical protein